MDIIIRARYFGRKAYGRVQGLATIISAPVSFAAPIFTGWIYDSTGKYTIAFILFTVLTGLSAFTLLFARVPKPLPPELNNSRIGKIK
jgi:nitrate/nitrite transporter NarK